MPRYVSLIRFTEQGVRAISKSPARAAAFVKTAKMAGVKVEAQFWTTGACDGVLIISANTEQQALSLLAKLNTLGNVRTETMQAFDAREFGRIVRK